MRTIEEKTEERTVVSAWVPVEAAADLRALADRESRSVSAELRRAIAGYLALQGALRRDERGRA